MENNVKPPYRTLSELQQIIGYAISCRPELQGVWVIAELSDLRVAGGHCYMELVEKDATGITRAKCRANIWANNFRLLRQKFYNATHKDLATGMKVLVRGTATHHPLYGLSFNIYDIDPTYTMGDIERLRREILERLRREGIIDRNQKLAFPDLPQCIAVISAAGAAGYGDFENQLTHNPDGFRFYPMLFGAVMQGDRTPGSICAALDRIEMALDFWDCVVIIRGGGATTDLNGFDDYELARRVALCPIPVVVGIGHERDRNVLDEIACIRCKTPTAVATFLCDCMRENYGHVIDLSQRVVRYASYALNGENIRIANIESALPAKLKTSLLKAERRLNEYSHAIERVLSSRLAAENMTLDRLRFRFEKALSDFTVRPRLRLQNLEDMIRVLSPANTLARGYSITRINGKAVTSAKDLKKGDVIVTSFTDGSVTSTINNTNRKQNGK